MNTEVRELTDAELNEVSGAGANLGGYTYCTYPQEGLYVGPCQEPPKGIIGSIKAYVDKAMGH